VKFKATILIHLRKGVRNSEAIVIKKSLHSIGYKEITNYTTGKIMTIELDAFDEDTAKFRVEKMCKELLVNLVIEEYKLIIEEIEDKIYAKKR
jgi:phosphoribosylformylglycinamidine synthase